MGQIAAPTCADYTAQLQKPWLVRSLNSTGNRATNTAPIMTRIACRITSHRDPTILRRSNSEDKSNTNQTTDNIIWTLDRHGATLLVSLQQRMTIQHSILEPSISSHLESSG